MNGVARLINAVGPVRRNSHLGAAAGCGDQADECKN
jgi:hypothetical protein